MSRVAALEQFRSHVAIEERELAQVLTIQSSRGPALARELPALLEGAEVGRIETREPTLEDAYVALVTAAGAGTS